MCSKIEQINVNDMFNRAMSISENTVITDTELMTDKVDVSMVVPTFIDDIGRFEEQQISTRYQFIV